MLETTGIKSDETAKPIYLKGLWGEYVMAGEPDKIETLSWGR